MLYPISITALNDVQWNIFDERQGIWKCGD